MQKCPSVESGQAGKAESCKGCPNAAICASSKPDEDIEIIKKRLSSFKLIIAVLSGKGGVGKSTMTRNIASSLARKGIKTLILDFDLSGPSIPRLTNTQDEFVYHSDETFKPISVEENLSAISIGHLEKFDTEVHVFTSKLKNIAIKKILKLCDFTGFDTLIIDTPPNITEEHLALVNYIQPHCSIIVTTPQKLSLNDVRRQVSFCRKVNIKILGLIENMSTIVCHKCKNISSIYKNDGIIDFCSTENINYLGSIHLSPEIARNSDSGNAVSLEIFENISTELYNNYLV